MSKKLRKAIFILILVWAAITIYFYFHNRVIVKTMKVPGWNLDDSQEMSFQVKEIRLINKKTRTYMPDPESKDLKSLVYQSQLIPNNIRYLLLNVLQFYSRNYVTSKDGWWLEVSGILIKPEKGSMTEEQLNEYPKIDIYVDGDIALPDGRSSQSSDYSNFRYFTAQTHDVKSNIKSVRIEWSVNGKNVSRVFAFPFKRKIYSIFDRIPREYENINPESVTSQAFWDFKKGKSITRFIINSNVNLLKQLGWSVNHKDITVINPYENYVGKYQIYNNTFSVTMNYIFGNVYTGNKDMIDGRQVFYLTEQQGKWVIVNIGSYERL